jgi:hypothetical protein
MPSPAIVRKRSGGSGLVLEEKTKLGPKVLIAAGVLVALGAVTVYLSGIWKIFFG